MNHWILNAGTGTDYTTGHGMKYIREEVAKIAGVDVIEQDEQPEVKEEKPKHGRPAKN